MQTPLAPDVGAALAAAALAAALACAAADARPAAVPAAFLAAAACLACLAARRPPARRPLLEQLDSVVLAREYGGHNSGDGVAASPCILRSRAGPIIVTSDRVVEPVTDVHVSEDDGKTWRHASAVDGAYWCTLFEHRGRMYLFGTTGEYGDVVVVGSRDRGESWPDRTVVTSGGGWHRAPTPVVRHGGRLWAALERIDDGRNWAAGFSAAHASAPEDADLMDRGSWAVSEPLPFPNTLCRALWGLGGQGFLEGNIVVGPGRRLYNILRVNRFRGGTAAVLEVPEDGGPCRPAGFIDFPGGATKFTVRRDPSAPHGYLSVVNTLDGNALRTPLPNPLDLALNVRRNLSLSCSDDMLRWRALPPFIQTDRREGVMYADWDVDGDDIIMALRCAAAVGGAVPGNPKASNVIGFKRLRGYRRLLR